MPASEGFFADPARLYAATRQIEQISEVARSLSAGFQDSLMRDVDWPGGDRFGRREIRPQERQERRTALQTSADVAQVVRLVADGTLGNLSTILNAQAGAMDDIARQQSRNGSRR
ncbi:hypothetical protein [Streptomyces sp. NPDC052721]|uniref:hypothetical protein n=1 Tax=Streptomyces sp. NPDC052721 TaxID=3154955 RepID=UPI003415293E